MEKGWKHKMAKGGGVGKKVYNTMFGVGSSKYVINYHNGVKTHKDGSEFFDIATFKNKVDFNKFVNKLKNDGYVQGHEHGGKMAKGGGVSKYSIDEYDLETLQSTGVSINQMKEILEKAYPDSFGFTLYEIKGNTPTNARNLIPNTDDYYGIKNDSLKIYFDRHHAMSYRVYQGGENTYFYFILQGSDNVEYIGSFGFKDLGDVPKEYVTSFTALLNKLYGFPLQVSHEVYAKGGGVGSSSEIYTLAKNMTDEEYNEKYNNLTPEQKNEVETLIRLGDEPKLALATILIGGFDLDEDSDTWKLYTMAKGGGVKSSNNVYKLRAEGLNDFLAFLQEGMYFRVKSFTVETTSGPDVVVSFETDASLSEIKTKLDEVPDSHVMLETIKPINEYTGERNEEYAKGGGVSEKLTKARLKAKLYKPSGDFFIEDKGDKWFIHFTPSDASRNAQTLSDLKAESVGKGFHGSAYSVSKVLTHEYAKGGGVGTSSKLKYSLYLDRIVGDDVTTYHIADFAAKGDLSIALESLKEAAPKNYIYYTK